MNVKARAYFTKYDSGPSDLLSPHAEPAWFDHCSFALISHAHYRDDIKATIKETDLFSFGAIPKPVVFSLYNQHIDTLGDSFSAKASVHRHCGCEYLCFSLRPTHSLQAAYLGVFRLTYQAQQNPNKLSDSDFSFALAQVTELTQQPVYSYAFESYAGHCQAKHLSHLEQKTIRLLAQGIGIQAISTQHIHKSRESINKYISTSKIKLGATSLSQLISRAVLLGII